MMGTDEEFFAAREILARRKDLELCSPIADHGWDLLALKNDGTAPIKIQVKESRVYANGNSWHQVRQGKLVDADVFVFVIYTPSSKGARTAFVVDFLVIPRKELEHMCKQKKCAKGKYSFYFVQEGRSWIERRDCRVDVSRFHAAWNLI